MQSGLERHKILPSFFSGSDKTCLHSPLIHSVPRIVSLIRARPITRSHKCALAYQYSRPSCFFNVHALIFSKFLDVKNRVYQRNMQKIYCICIFDYEGQNPWHTWYLCMCFWPCGAFWSTVKPEVRSTPNGDHLPTTTFILGSRFNKAIYTL